MLSREPLASAKNHRAVRLRPAANTDVPGIVELERAVIAAGEGVVKTPDDVHDRRALKTLSERIGNGLWAVAEWADDAGRIIGCCRLDQHKASLIRHVESSSTCARTTFARADSTNPWASNWKACAVASCG